MGARNRRRSGNDRYGSRPVRRLSPHPSIIIVCDDTTTAVRYFEELKRQVKARVTVHVAPAPKHGMSAKEVVACAKAKTKAILKGRPANKDRVWALIDLEAESAKRTEAKQCKDACLSSGIVQVALSDPCFEVWTLLHFIDTGRPFADCTDVLKLLSQEWNKAAASSGWNQFGKKAQIDVSHLMGDRQQQAISRAKQHHETVDPSSTEVYRVVEYILNVGKESE